MVEDDLNYNKTPASIAISGVEEKNQFKQSEELKAYPYTTSEAHMKGILGKAYNEKNLDENIRTFLSKEQKESPEDIEKHLPLIKTILEAEYINRGAYALYNGTTAEFGLLYDFFTQLQNALFGTHYQDTRIFRFFEDIFEDNIKKHYCPARIA